MVYPYDNDLPIGAVSPFGEVTMPEEAIFAADMGEVLPAPVDLSVPDVNPLTLPSAESFAEDMARQEAEAAPLPPEGDPIPLAEPGEFEQDVALVEPEQEFFQPFEGLGEAGVLDRPGPPTVGAEEFGEGLAPFEEEPVQPTVEEMSDETLMLQALRQEQEKEAERIRLTGERIEADATQRESNLKTYEDAHREARQETERIFEDSKALAREGVDNNRWWSSRSSGQKIASYISVLAGGQLGLISGRGGNEALKMLMGEIDKDIDAQKFSIQNQRAGLQEQQGLVSRLYQQSGNLYQATETARLAALQGMTAEIDNQLAKIDPEGTQAMSLEVKKRQIQAAQAAQAQKVEQAGREEAVQRAKDKLNARKVEAEIALKTQQASKMRAEAAKLARRGTGRKKVQEPSIQQKLAARKANLVWDPSIGNFVPIGQEPGEEAPETFEEARRREKVALAEKAERAIGPETLSVAGIVDSAGKPVLFQDATIAKEVSILKSKSTYAIDIIDNMVAAIEKHGWSSDTLRSPEWQRARTNGAELTNVFKDTGEYGVIAGADLDLINAQSGMGDDVTGVRDPTPGLKQARKNLEKKLHFIVKGYRENAQPIKIPKQSIAPTPETKTRADKVEILSAPTAVDLKGDTKTDISSRVSVIDEFMKEKPGEIELHEVGQTLKKRVESGEMPLKVAWATSEKLGIELAKGRLKRLEAQTVPGFTGSAFRPQLSIPDVTPEMRKKIVDVKFVADGLATPKEAYDLLIGEFE